MNQTQPLRHTILSIFTYSIFFIIAIVLNNTMWILQIVFVYIYMYFIFFKWTLLSFKLARFAQFYVHTEVRYYYLDDAVELLWPSAWNDTQILHSVAAARSK